MVFEKIDSIATSAMGKLIENFNEYEQVVFCNDPSTGLKAIISMHSTVLGPAVGGCRMWNYTSEQEALNDVLRLSRGMTYKNSISGLNWGGGKAVIIGDPKAAKNPEMLKRFGEYVTRLSGNYITAKDVGIGAEDLRNIKKGTKHILGIDGEPGSSGDPSPATAWGVYHGMKASAKHAFGTNSLKGLKVALQGLGSVSYYMLEHLAADGAELIGCDIDQACIDRAMKKYKIEIVKPESIYDVACDIFAPCALGATINSETLPRIKAKVIAGAANNQLATESDGVQVMRRGMTYAPDYAINAGGVMNIYHERAEGGGYNKARAFDHVSQIGQTIEKILARSAADKMPSHQVADRMAEERVIKARRG
jgi:leucine dehydrogenase